MAVVFLAIGLSVTFYAGLPRLNQARASASWPKTSGVVKESSVASQRSSSRFGRRASKRKRNRKTYRAEICFQYEVEGRQYLSEQISAAGNSYSSAARANRIASKYSKGKQVDVFYNPNDPTIAMLEPGVTGGSFIILGLGLLLSVIGLVIGAITTFRFVAQ